MIIIISNIADDCEYWKNKFKNNRLCDFFLCNLIKLKNLLTYNKTKKFLAKNLE